MASLNTSKVHCRAKIAVHDFEEYIPGSCLRLHSCHTGTHRQSDRRGAYGACRPRERRGRSKFPSSACSKDRNPFAEALMAMRLYALYHRSRTCMFSHTAGTRITVLNIQSLGTARHPVLWYVMRFYIFIMLGQLKSCRRSNGISPDYIIYGHQLTLE